MKGAPAATPPPPPSPPPPAHRLTPSQIRRSLLAHFTASLTIGLAVGGIIPLIAVTLEARGVDSVVIGINSAMTSLGVLAVAPFVPAIVRRIGAITGIVAGLSVCSASVLAMAFVENIWLWLVLRFLIGAGVAVQWVVSETWMNAVTDERRRGLVMAVYVTSIAAGFALGPIMLTLLGTDGVLPFAAVALVIAATALPVIPIRRLVPPLALETSGNVLRLMREAPTIFAAVMAVGLVDAAFFTFLPLYGLRIGMAETQAITLLSVVFAGNLFLQIPLGWIADRVSRRGVLLALGAICIACPPLAAMVLGGSAGPAYAVLFVWGGASFGLYTVGVTMLGERYLGGELAAANAAFVMTFELANLIGPPLAGWSIEGWSIEGWAPNGLMAYMTAVAAAFVAVTALRGWMRARQVL